MRAKRQKQSGPLALTGATAMLITDPLFYAIAIPVVLLTGISKTGIPGLFGGMAVPLLSLVIPPLQAAALMLPILCFIDVFGLRAFRGVYDRRNMPIMLTGLIIGIVVGVAELQGWRILEHRRHPLERGVRLTDAGGAVIARADQIQALAGDVEE